MITQDTHRIDWRKTAQATGVVLIALGKAIWWLARKGGILLVTILTVLAKVIVALISVWASSSQTNAVDNDEIETELLDAKGFDLTTGQHRVDHKF